MAFASYLNEVLPVMAQQDERLKMKMQAANDDGEVQALLQVMMVRTRQGCATGSCDWSTLCN